jgi:hypothetical protein
MARKRELIEPKGDKRYIRRDERGRIKESDDVGRSLRPIGAGRRRPRQSPGKAIRAIGRAAGANPENSG